MSDKERPGEADDEKITEATAQPSPRKLLVFGKDMTDQEMADALNAMDDS